MSAADDFDERSIERGAVLFANEPEPEDTTRRPRCCAPTATASQGEGGTAPFVLQPEARQVRSRSRTRRNPDVPECLPKQVAWAAPALNTAPALRRRRRSSQIITYGRPGTPMPAWGVESGKGVLNKQSINDLVNFIKSIQITPEEAVQIATEAVPEYRQGARDVVDNAETALEDAQTALDGGTGRLRARPRPSSPPPRRTSRPRRPSSRRRPPTRPRSTELSDGAILFRLNCARCHTKGWSYYDPTALDVPEPAPQGSGAYGPEPARRVDAAAVPRRGR